MNPVPDCPDVENSFKDLLDASLLEKADDGRHARDVDVDLAVGVLVHVLKKVKENRVDSLAEFAC
jgi:hypothetical protein